MESLIEHKESLDKSKEASIPSLVELLAELDDPQLNVEEVACLLCMHPETIRRWCRQGRIVYFQVGRGKIHIPLSSIGGIKRRRLLPGTPMLPKSWAL